MSVRSDPHPSRIGPTDRSGAGPRVSEAMDAVEPRAGTVALRVLVLGALIAAANAWLVHHAGIDVAGLAAVNVFIGVCAFLLGYVGDPDRAAVERGVRGVVRRLADPCMPLGLGLCLAFAGSLTTEP